MGKQVTVATQISTPGLLHNGLYVVGTTLVFSDAEYAQLPAEVIAALTNISTVADPTHPAPTAASGEAFSVIIRSGAAEPDNTFVTMPQPLTGTDLIGRTVNHPIGTVAPAGGFRCEFDGPVDVQASLDFYVYSADGSQILERSIVSDSLITANSPGPTRFIDFDQPSVQKGSDLSWDPVTKQIVSASGGIFGAVIWAQYHLPA